MSHQRNLAIQALVIIGHCLGLCTAVSASDGIPVNPSAHEIDISAENVEILNKIHRSYELQLKAAAPDVNDEDANVAHKTMVERFEAEGVIPGSLLESQTKPLSSSVFSEVADDYIAIVTVDPQLIFGRCFQALQVLSNGSLTMTRQREGHEKPYFTRWLSLRGSNIEVDGNNSKVSSDGYRIRSDIRGYREISFFRKDIPVVVAEKIREVNESGNGLQGFINKFCEEYEPSLQALGGNYITTAEFLFQRFVLEQAVSNTKPQDDLVPKLWIGDFIAGWETLDPEEKFVFRKSDNETNGAIGGSKLFSDWEIDSRGQTMLIGSDEKIYLPRFSEDYQRMVVDICGKVFFAYSMPDPNAPD